ncbi:hypothetical protein [Bacillus haynesii]|uniref:hypothetical protein n=1 Tax=Bacillus haynesii TaxID=1925021 RepID=UPI002280C2C8|nr:hypothetical protein [Bacillus haynesii]MCY8090771.1 hypothetical protein [Bacillus haynesii]MCY8292182.1 hypothetical protein [Bacillus haynesii]MCY8409684.1 hypothetical protein [Bacillus haynesii]MCY8434558.1 hypothetical protein [Bacillus haynesii]MCY8626314.1 hypothetical protein [Bacillus haynesii]
MKKRETESKILNLDSALILGYITLVGYLMAYSYQTSYFEYFKIPSEFLENISINTILIAIISLSGFLSILLLLYNIFREITSSGDTPVIKRIKAITPLNLIIFGVLIYFKTKIYIFIGLGVLLITYIYNFTLPLLLIRTKGYNNKLSRFHSDENEDSFKENLYYTYRKRPGAFLIFMFSISLIITTFSGLVGNENANKQKTFAVTKIDGAEFIVFEIQGDKAIIGELKRDEIIPKYKKVEIENLIIEKKTFNKIKVSE